MFSVSCKSRAYFSKWCLEIASPLTPQVYRCDFTLDILDPWVFFAQCKGTQDSLALWIPHLGFLIPGSGFRPLSMDRGFWIQLLVGFWIDSLGCIPDSKAQDSQFYGFRNPDFLLTWGDILSNFPQCRTNYVSLRSWDHALSLLSPYVSSGLVRS